MTNRAGPWRSWNLLAGGGLVAAVVIIALVAVVWTPFPAGQIRIVEKLQGPGARHWLGTDPFGRDVLAMIMVGARHSLAVAGLAVALGITIGVPLGLAAAARRDWVDDLVGRFADLVFAFPAILTAILLTALHGAGAVNAVLAIGVFNIAVFTRVTRNAAAQVWRREFVRAALALGRTPPAITRVHILPNIAGTLAVQATVAFAVAILGEAALSYLGLGIQPPAPSWGKMLNDAQSYLYQAPTLAVFPGAAIAVTVLGLNLLGDGLRDALDPRRQPGGGGRRR